MENVEKTDQERISVHKKIGFALFVVIFLLLIGTTFYHQTEQWSYVDSLYFSTMTLTTVGYGDLIPSTDLTKIFTSIYALIGIGIMLYLLISVISEYILTQESRFDRVLNRMKELTHTFTKKTPDKKTKNK